jgi:hypothetical protein
LLGQNHVRLFVVDGLYAHWRFNIYHPYIPAHVLCIQTENLPQFDRFEICFPA